MIYELMIVSKKINDKGKSALITYFECNKDYPMYKIEKKVKAIYPELKHDRIMISKKAITHLEWLKISGERKEVN